MSEIKVLSTEEVRRMQLLQLGMLEELDRVCRKHNIKYCIYAGTMIGAVRHKGYIPWDDDADVAMLREEYEKFKQVAHELNPDICFFQDHDTDPEYPWGYAKLRRTGTTYIRTGQEHLKCKTGVFIDVFPFDDIPATVPGQIVNDIYCFILRKIIWSQVGKYDESSGPLLRKWYSLLSKIPQKYVYSLIGKMAQKSSNDSPNRVRILMFPSDGKMTKKNNLKTRYGYPKEYFRDLAEYEFEGKLFWGSKDYDGVLRYAYDDYMQLPPEDQRDPHSPVSEYSF